MKDTELELYKIRVGFDRVKSDILHLYEKIKLLEAENNQLKKDLARKEVKTKVLPTKKEEDKVYIGNKTSKKIHASDCPYAKNITSENREIFSTLNDALRKKYVTCSCLGQ